MPMDRVRKVTKTDGTDPHYMDGRVIVTALPAFVTLNMTQPILVDGADYQSKTPRQFSITFVGRIYEDTPEEFRAFLDGLIGEKRDADGVLVSEGIFGLRNRRFYLFDDRYWIVRHEGTHLLHPYPGIRAQFASMELYLRVLDPYLRDNVGNLYRAW